MSQEQAEQTPQVEQQTADQAPSTLLERVIDETDLGLEERRFELDQRYATVMAKSGFFADAAQQAQSLTKMMICRALGVDPVLNQKEVTIVKGRVSFSAELCDFLMKRGGYTWKMVQHDAKACAIAPYFQGQRITQEDGKPVIISFTYEDAKTAGLTEPMGDKKLPSMYDKYGRNLLISRCKTNFQRWYAPEVTKGMTVYSDDELEEVTVNDETDAAVMAEGLAAPNKPQLKRLSEKAEVAA